MATCRVYQLRVCMYIYIYMLTYWHVIKSDDDNNIGW